MRYAPVGSLIAAGKREDPGGSSRPGPRHRARPAASADAEDSVADLLRRVAGGLGGRTGRGPGGPGGRTGATDRGLGRRLELLRGLLAVDAADDTLAALGQSVVDLDGPRAHLGHVRHGGAAQVLRVGLLLELVDALRHLADLLDREVAGAGGGVEGLAVAQLVADGHSSVPSIGVVTRMATSPAFPSSPRNDS